MDYLIVALACLAGGLVGGYLLSSHIHSVAAQAATQVNTAVQRALTVPAGDVAKLDAIAPNAGAAIQASTSALADHITATVNAAADKIVAAGKAPTPSAPVG